ncbi:serine/threonine protein kinase [candidate division KSB1 bacterium]|nr:serine/threonine protein kinase [candidate division KSB1 bacterium]NIR71586.1 serine/threonine protein kinase [candidate division KSB1 bacterium]NIS27968.1 serine/threonine protein kinase [candidate division KSB1 bacterium]NIT74850.1 serine/threonine protein kinase [candidate division KSB1 bacterium]NIU28625.1 serine/threonine protein kinase [candidate division KSB1 bacterium]
MKLAEVQDLVAAHADSIASDQEIADIEIDSAMTSGAEIVSSGDSVTIDLPVQSKPDTQSIEVSEAVEQEPETVQAQGDFPLVSMDSLEAAPITQAEDSTTWQEASKPIASPNDGDSNLSTSRISSDGFSSFYWIAAILAGILIVVLVILKRNHTNKSQPRDDSTHDKTVVVDADQNDDMFKDEVASVTPVRFDSLETSEILDEEDENKEEDAFLAFKDTQTILGGIKKVQRIGRYILEKEIGRGSMGLIYKAWDPKLDRTVVIKQVSFDFTRNQHEIAKLKDRLFREARAAGRLNHENIVIIYDVDEEKNFSYIVMEYLEGSDLKMRLEKAETFDLPRTIKIIKQVCSALEFAHDSGIVHRDIKPSNIILTRNDKVKVADFGIAKLAHLGTLTQTGSIVGTPFYMSPEQVEGRKLDGRSDIFSVGVILYEMLTSKHPFEGDNITTVVYKIVHKSPKRPSMINRDLPSSVDAMVQRACAKNPKHRYTNAGQLFADLNKLEGELS